ncbi:MAG: carboxymuconolactone decarboxylase family protein [Myxococcota bacterium]
MARLPYIDPGTASSEVRETLGALPASLNIFRIVAHAPTCLRPWVRLGGAILGRQQLDGALRELAILHVARLSGAHYEWVQHVPIARAAGVGEDRIAALKRDETDAACFTPLERKLLRFTREVVQEVKASQESFDSLAQELSPREIVELLLAIGFYMMVARLLETTETDPDAPAGATLVEGIR